MAVEAEIDVGLPKSEIKKTYASVSEEPGRDFIFPIGRACLHGCHTVRSRANSDVEGRREDLHRLLMRGRAYFHQVLGAGSSRIRRARRLGRVRRARAESTRA